MRPLFQSLSVVVLLLGTGFLARAESPQSKPRVWEFGRVDVDINLGSGFFSLDRAQIERDIRGESGEAMRPNLALKYRPSAPGRYRVRVRNSGLPRNFASSNSRRRGSIESWRAGVVSAEAWIEIEGPRGWIRAKGVGARRWQFVRPGDIPVFESELGAPLDANPFYRASPRVIPKAVLENVEREREEKAAKREEKREEKRAEKVAERAERARREIGTPKGDDRRDKRDRDWRDRDRDRDKRNRDWRDRDRDWRDEDWNRPPADWFSFRGQGEVERAARSAITQARLDAEKQVLQQLEK